jgi:hypothetical protein
MAAPQPETMQTNECCTVNEWATPQVYIVRVNSAPVSTAHNPTILSESLALRLRSIAIEERMPPP